MRRLALSVLALLCFTACDSTPLGDVDVSGYYSVTWVADGADTCGATQVTLPDQLVISQAGSNSSVLFKVAGCPFAGGWSFVRAAGGHVEASGPVDLLDCDRTRSASVAPVAFEVAGGGFDVHVVVKRFNCSSSFELFGARDDD